MDFVGWYTTGDVPDQMDVQFHKQVRFDLSFFACAYFQRFDCLDLRFERESNPSKNESWHETDRKGTIPMMESVRQMQCLPLG